MTVRQIGDNSAKEKISCKEVNLAVARKKA